MTSKASRLELQAVTFGYGRSKSKILDSVNISFGTESTLLLGRNGAGKSTLLKLAGEIFQEKSGKILRQGRVIYLPQSFIEVPGLSCRDYVAHLAWLAGQSSKRARCDADKWLEAVGLAGKERTSNTQLSGGQRARLALAYALNAGADLVLLDEPGAALDPLSKKELHELYRIVEKTGAGLVVSSHDPADMGGPFNRVVLVDAGHIRFDGTIEEFATRDHEDPLVSSFAAAMQRHTRGAGGAE